MFCHLSNIFYPLQPPHIQCSSSAPWWHRLQLQRKGESNQTPDMETHDGGAHVHRGAQQQQQLWANAVSSDATAKNDKHSLSSRRCSSQSLLLCRRCCRKEEIKTTWQTRGKPLQRNQNALMHKHTAVITFCYYSTCRCSCDSRLDLSCRWRYGMWHWWKCSKTLMW